MTSNTALASALRDLVNPHIEGANPDVSSPLRNAVHTYAHQVELGYASNLLDVARHAAAWRKRSQAVVDSYAGDLTVTLSPVTQDTLRYAAGNVAVLTAVENAVMLAWTDASTTGGTKPNTPGYNCHLTIEFTYDKNGRKLAHYTAPRSGFRRFRVSTASAEVWIAQGLATRS